MIRYNWASLMLGVPGGRFRNCLYTFLASSYSLFLARAVSMSTMLLLIAPKSSGWIMSRGVIHREGTALDIMDDISVVLDHLRHLLLGSFGVVGLLWRHISGCQLCRKLQSMGRIRGLVSGPWLPFVLRTIHHLTMRSITCLPWRNSVAEFSVSTTISATNPQTWESKPRWKDHPPRKVEHPPA